MVLPSEIVELDSIDLTETAAKLRENHISQAGSEELSEKRFPKYDWQRLSYVYDRLENGEKCLEVGPGRCHLTTMLDREPKFEKVTAIDILDRRVPKSTDFHIMSVVDMDFEDNEFDSVLCMEVLEHLSESDFHKGLEEIRRVCKKQLIVSVPFCEPMPSKYHTQSFTTEKVLNFFPAGKYRLLLKKPVMRVPWMMIEEYLS